MAENKTTDQTTQGAGADTGAQTLRDVPGNISEYQKFKADGGLEHNQQLQGREAAVAAAKAAGILPEADQVEEHKSRSNFQRRVSRLQRKIGERDAQIADLQKRVSASAAASAAPAQNGAHAASAERAGETSPAVKPNGEAKTPPRPKEDDFKTYGEFVEALTDWKTDRKLEAAEAKRAEDRARSEAENKGKAVTDAHNLRVDEAKTRYPDWDKAFKGLDDNSYTDPMVVFIFESDRGPDVTYYLATHREELERIAKLSPVRQVAALAKIEEQFGDAGDEGEVPQDDKPAKKPATIPADDEDDEEDEEAERKPKPRAAASKAPPPAKPLGGRAAPADQMPDPKDFAAYSKWSKRQAEKNIKR
jgi:hypothetical protein